MRKRGLDSLSFLMYGSYKGKNEEVEEEKLEEIASVDIVARNWKKIIEHLESSIDIALEDSEHVYAIEQAMLLEEACKAHAGQKYSFEGKLNVQ